MSAICNKIPLVVVVWTCVLGVVVSGLNYCPPDWVEYNYVCVSFNNLTAFFSCYALILCLKVLLQRETYVICGC